MYVSLWIVIISASHQESQGLAVLVLVVVAAMVGWFEAESGHSRKSFGGNATPLSARMGTFQDCPVTNKRAISRRQREESLSTIEPLQEELQLDGARSCLVLSWHCMPPSVIQVAVNSQAVDVDHSGRTLSVERADPY